MKTNQIYVILLVMGVFLTGTLSLKAQTLEEKKWIAEGNTYYLQKEYEKARVEYSKVLATTPSSYKANFNLGNSYFELKNYKNAESHFQKASESAANNIEKANAFHNLGNSLMQQKAYKKAIEAYKNSLRNNPKDNQTRYNFALAKKLLSLQDKKQNPSDLPRPSAYAQQMKSKADSTAATGNFGAARELMMRALAKDSTVAHYQSYLDKLNEIIILDSIEIK